MADGIKELDLSISSHMLFLFIHLQAGGMSEKRKRIGSSNHQGTHPQGLQELYFQHMFMLSQWLTHQ